MYRGAAHQNGANSIHQVAIVAHMRLMQPEGFSIYYVRNYAKVNVRERLVLMFSKIEIGFRIPNANTRNENSL